MLKITDPCYGDSGGPLAIWRAGHWQLVGVLEVFLYFRVCICIIGADWSTILKGRGIQLFFFLLFFSDFSLKGEGFNCETNETSGDGSWSNVATQKVTD